MCVKQRHYLPFLNLVARWYSPQLELIIQCLPTFPPLPSLPGSPSHLSCTDRGAEAAPGRVTVLERRRRSFTRHDVRAAAAACVCLLDAVSSCRILSVGARRNKVWVLGKSQVEGIKRVFCSCLFFLLLLLLLRAESKRRNPHGQFLDLIRRSRSWSDQMDMI